MMLVMIEISKPFQKKPWVFRSRIHIRIGWGWFAFSWIKLPYEEYVLTPKDFVTIDGKRIRNLDEWRTHQDRSK